MEQPITHLELQSALNTIAKFFEDKFPGKKVAIDTIGITFENKQSDFKIQSGNKDFADHLVQKEMFNISVTNQICFTLPGKDPICI